jgi:beta propeller repeat protein
MITVVGLTLTASHTVTLDMEADGPAPIEARQLSEAIDFEGAAWQPFVSTCSFVLSAGDGCKTIYARFRDTTGAISPTVDAMVYLDTTPPVIWGLPGDTTAAPGTNKIIQAAIVDTWCSVDSATLYYRAKGTSTFSHVSFDCDNEYACSATIPGTAIRTTPVEYYVKATDELGNSGTQPSDAPASTYTIQPTATPPPTPQLLIGTPSNGKVSLSWQPVLAADLDHYNVYCASAASGPFILAGQTTNEYWSMPSPDDRTYYFEVSSVDSFGDESAPTSPVEVYLPQVLDRLDVIVPNSAYADEPFSITVNAYDTNGEVMTSFAGPVTLGVYNGSSALQPTTISGFTNGSASAEVTYPGPDIISISATAGSIVGHSAYMEVDAQPTPTPTPSFVPSAGTPFLIATSLAGDPAISGNTVVWMGFPMAGAQIRGYDLTTGIGFPIPTSQEPQMEMFSDDTVVWADSLWHLWGYDLASKTEFPIDSSAADSSPVISGSIVAWVVPSSGDHVRGYNLASKTAFPISNEAMASNPSISGNTVVWQDDRDFTHDEIYGFDLASKTEFPIRTFGQFGPGNAYDASLYGYDLAGKTTFQICTHAGTPSMPLALSGDIVVWIQIEGDTSNVWGYDLASKAKFLIHTDIGQDNCIAIDGNTVVWGTVLGLYGATLGL